MPVEFAEEVFAALIEVRGAAYERWERLVPRGDGLLSETAMVMAEWALGWRAASAHPRAGPWESRELTAYDREVLDSLEEAYEAWSAVAFPG
ncbi:MAG: hypothetical protein ACKVS7_16370, partial [Gemmatimonadaceae bacterium]